MVSTLQSRIVRSAVESASATPVLAFSNRRELSAPTTGEMNFPSFPPCSSPFSWRIANSQQRLWRCDKTLMNANVVIPHHRRGFVCVVGVDGVADHAVSFARRGRACRAGR
jgi:hypothetical protein